MAERETTTRRQGARALNPMAWHRKRWVWQTALIVVPITVSSQTLAGQSCVQHSTASPEIAPSSIGAGIMTRDCCRTEARWTTPVVPI